MSFKFRIQNSKKPNATWKKQKQESHWDSCWLRFITANIWGDLAKHFWWQPETRTVHIRGQVGKDENHHARTDNETQPKMIKGQKGGKTRAGSKTMEMESENQNIKIKQEVTKQQIIKNMLVKWFNTWCCQVCDSVEAEGKIKVPRKREHLCWFFHPFSNHRLFLTQVRPVAVAYPSCLGVKAELHCGYVASLSRGHNCRPRSHSYLQIIRSWEWT